MHRNHVLPWHLILVTLILMVIGPSAASPQKATADPYAWTRQEWAGEDSPYLKAETDIQRQVTADENPDKIIKEYKAVADKSPNDELASFQWAFASFASLSERTPIGLAHRRIDPLTDVMLAVPPPYTHRYMRLLYLISPRNLHLRWLGERLIKTDPNDQDVLYAQTFVLDDVLAHNFSPETRSTAVEYASQLTKKAPDRARSWAALGFAYSASTEALKQNPGDADKAIHAFERELALLGPRNDYSYVVRGIIKSLQNWISVGHY